MIFDRRNDIERFIAVAEAGSVLAGADALGMTQPALSRVIIRLERESLQPLFDRHNRGVTLTEFGVKALECARRLLREHEAADSELIGASDAPEAAARTPGQAVALTPEEHRRLSDWLVQKALKHTAMQVLLDQREDLSAMSRHQLGRLAAACRSAYDDSAALTRAADIVRCAAPGIKA